ncbi:MAG TPA: alpha/beta hydrolase [Pseudonocardiaceae bacterium]|jgi:acetyl esterase/lipase|nr:alpha/beta hydrolase [Pseudonocardiaceae bacterium]
MRRAGTVLAVGAGLTGVVVNVFARRAPWRRYPWYLPGLVAGLAGTEFAGPVAGAQVVAGALATAFGARRGRLGFAGLAVTAATSAGLYQLRRSSTDASIAELNGALADALGADRTTLGRPKSRIFARQPRARYLVAEDVAYGTDSPAQVLDIWRRPDLPRTAAAGVLVMVHGGSWVGGGKRMASPQLLAELAERGWVCVSVDYRLGPDNRWPSPIVDVKKAIAWVRANIADHGGDPGFIAVSGGSAGGHLAALAALSANDPAFQPGFPEADTAVQAAALLYGVYDLTARNDDGSTRLRDYVRKVLFDADLVDDTATWHAASPSWRSRADPPPMFVVHGDRDEIVTVSQARRFVDAVRLACREPFGYAELPYAHHAFDMVRSARAMATVEAVCQFLDVMRDRARRPARHDVPAAGSVEQHD